MKTSTKSASLGSRGLWREERGAEVVEFAFVVPLLLALLVGIVWAARAYNVHETVTRAAREGARVAVAPTCFGCGTSGAFLSSSGGCGGGDAIDTAVVSSLTASGLPCTPSVTVSVTQHSKLGDDKAGSATPWTVVTVTYPFQLVVPFTSVNLTTVNISATAQMVEEP